MATLGAASISGVPAFGLPKIRSLVGGIVIPIFAASPLWSTSANSVTPLAHSPAARQRRHAVRAGGPQRGSGEDRNDDASDQAPDLRQPKSRHAADACRAERRHRPAAEDPGVGGCAGEGLAFLQ